MPPRAPVVFVDRVTGDGDRDGAVSDGLWTAQPVRTLSTFGDCAPSPARSHHPAPAEAAL